MNQLTMLNATLPEPSAIPRGDTNIPEPTNKQTLQINIYMNYYY